MLFAGEIDIRGHFANQWPKRGDPNILANELALRGVRAMVRLADMTGARPAVTATTPASTGTESPVYPVRGTPKERVAWTATLNDAFRSACAETGVTFIDHHAAYVDGRGILRSDLSDGHVHILASHADALVELLRDARLLPRTTPTVDRVHSMSVDDLPSYSPWPARLLGLEPWVTRTKSRAEVLREFDQEKWGRLLDAAEQRGGQLTLEEADLAFLSSGLAPGAQPHLVRGSLQLLEPRHGYEVYLDLFDELVASHLSGCSALVELGAGYGRVAIGMALRHPGLPVIAGELSSNGRRVIDAIAATEGASVEARVCDLVGGSIMTPPPPDSVVYTSFAAHYEQLDSAFVQTVAAWKPRAVIHLEPVLEHLRTDSILGLLQRRYLEVNGYHGDLLDQIRALAASGEIDILNVVPALYGGNPLLPASGVVWRPVDGLSRP